jgi:hypothetical protein
MNYARLIFKNVQNGIWIGGGSVGILLIIIIALLVLRR